MAVTTATAVHPLTPPQAVQLLVLRNYMVYRDAWKLFDLPKNLTGDQTASAAVGYFFLAAFDGKSETDAPMATGAVSAEMQKLTGDLERLDKQLAAAKPTDLARLNAGLPR